MWDWIAKLAELQTSGDPFVLVTITKIIGSTPREVGAKMIVMPSGLSGTIGGGKLEEWVAADALRCLEDRESKGVRYPLCAKVGQCCGGSVEVFLEPLNLNPVLYLFGAGHVGQAVCETLNGTPFRVHAVDPRPEWIDSPLLKTLPVTRHSESWETFVKTARWDERDVYAVIMTHDHAVDEALVEALLDKPCKYLGLIGSRAKWERFQLNLESKGVSAESLKRVRSPIGLPIGGKAPKEVAISLASELLKLFYER